MLGRRYLKDLRRTISVESIPGSKTSDDELSTDWMSFGVFVRHDVQSGHFNPIPMGVRSLTQLLIYAIVSTVVSVSCVSHDVFATRSNK